MCHLDGPADFGNGLALCDQLLSGFELANDLLGGVADSFHGGVPGPVWPDEDSHSPWTDFQGPRHLSAAPGYKDRFGTTALGVLETPGFRKVVTP